MLVLSLMLLAISLLLILALLPAIAMALLLRRLARPPQADSPTNALFLLRDMR